MRARGIAFGLLVSTGLSGAFAAETITVTRLDCLRIIAHEPAGDVAYRPGVDAAGRPVAAAEIDGGAEIVIPDSFTIPITVDLHERLGLPSTPGAFEGEIQVGTVVWRDGQAWFDGRPLQTGPDAEIVRLCEAYLARHERR